MQRIIDGIRKFRQSHPDGEDFISQELVAAQKPDILLVTCSDSRVVPSLVTRSDPGRLFVIRNAGNILPPAGSGSSEEGTIEYGVDVLGIRHLVVCGHTHCGAMAGLFDAEIGKRIPAVARWLEHARPSRERAEACGGAAAQAVYENVRVQLERARSYPAVRRALEVGELELHGWVYDIQTARFSRFDPVRETWADLLDDAEGRRTG